MGSLHRHTGAYGHRILVDNHIRRGIGLTDSQFDTFGQIMGFA